MCSGIRSVGTSTSGRGKRPSSAMRAAYGSGPDEAPRAMSRGLSPGHGPSGRLGARASTGVRPRRRALARVCPMAARSDGSGPREPGDVFFRPSVRALTPYQPGKPVEDVQRELGLARVVKLASNEGPFGPFPAAEEALARNVQELNRYPDGGSYRLHAALAERHDVPFEQVSVGAGADGCIDMLSQAILDPGDEVVCGWPSFPSYVIYASKQGAKVVTVALRDHRYDLDALLDAVTARTKLLYVCHPNNPTGTTNSRADVDSLFDRVPDHVLVVVDQAYFEYIDDPEYPDAVEEYVKRGRRAIVLRTFSKIYGLAGLRVGYAVEPRRRVAAGAKVRRPFDVTTTAQVAALASLGDEAEIARRRAVNADGLRRLDELL